MRNRLGQIWEEHRAIFWLLVVAGGMGYLAISSAIPAGEKLWPTLRLHAGLALWVAAIVGVFALLHEFREIFLRLLEQVLVDQRFFEALDTDKLEEIGAKAFKARIRKSITNPRHEWQTMYEAVASDVLPLVHKEHRTGYEEDTHLEFMTLQAASEELGILPVGNPELEVCRVTSTTRFRLVSSRGGKPSNYRYDYEEEVERIPGIPPNQHVQATIQKEGQGEIPVDLAIEERGEILLIKGTAQIEYEEECVLRMVTRVWEHEIPFVLLKMVTLTRDFSMTVVSNKPLPFQWHIFTMGGQTDPPVVNPQSIRLQHRGWLLPNHGGIIYWT